MKRWDSQGAPWQVWWERKKMVFFPPISTVSHCPFCFPFYFLFARADMSLACPAPSNDRQSETEAASPWFCYNAQLSFLPLTFSFVFVCALCLFWYFASTVRAVKVGRPEGTEKKSGNKLSSSPFSAFLLPFVPNFRFCLLAFTFVYICLYLPSFLLPLRLFILSLESPQP